MALSDLPVTYRLTPRVPGHPEFGFRATVDISPIRADGGRQQIYVRARVIGSEFVMQFGIGDPIGDTAGPDFDSAVEASALINAAASTGGTVYDGDFQGDASEPYTVVIGRTGYDLLRSSATLWVDLTFRTADPALRVAVRLGRPSIGVKLSAPPLPVAVRPAAPELYSGIHAPPLPVGISPAAPKFFLDVSAPPLPVAVRPARPEFHLALHALPLPVAVAVGRPEIKTDLRAPPLPVTAGVERPRLASPAETRERMRISLRSSSPEARIVTALELTHPAAVRPARLVDDTQTLTIDGDDYTPARFEAALPDDMERRSPAATIRIGNTGRVLTDWINLTDGGAGAEITLMQISLLDGAVSVDWQLTMDVATVSLDADTVTATLGFDPFLSLPSVALRYDPQTAPGLF
ncbi:MAG: DUF1833 family protein [Rhodobacteraceae bacterium]|nr:DUF1833 family protein [Paracoccaceae bacterium]